MPAKPKTTGQLRAIFGEARKRGLDNEQLHDLVAGVVQSSNSSSDRTIPRRGPRAATPGGEKVGAADRWVATAVAALPFVSIKSLTYAQAEAVIQRLKGSSFVPRRTLQYRRKKAGVTQVVQRDQILLIAALATQREWSTETLVKFCKRQCGHHPLRTTADANKVIEALKAMNRRDDLWAA